MRDPDDKREFAEIMRATLDLYGKDSSPPVLRLWFAALERFSIDEVRAGMSRYIQSTDSGTFPPKPADVIRMIEGSGQERGMLAWSKVSAAFSRVGAWQSIAFDDPTIHKVVDDMGGWVSLCGGTEDEQPFKAAEFAKRYRAYCEAGGPKAWPSYLIGIAEANNTAAGYKSEPPLLAGDPEACQRVISGGVRAAALPVSRGVAMLADLANECAAERAQKVTA